MPFALFALARRQNINGVIAPYPLLSTLYPLLYGLSIFANTFVTMSSLVTSSASAS
jgi:hypothetical protein